MTIPRTSCPLGLTPTTVAAWLDGALDAAETERLAAHLRECAACHAELAVYAALDAALRAQAEPEPDERLWRGVHAALPARRRRQVPRWITSARARRVGAIAAAILLVAGFIRLFQSDAPRLVARPVLIPAGSPVPIPSLPPPTAPVLGVSALHWTTATLPPLPAGAVGSLGWSIFPGDGRIAYACEALSRPTGQPISIWMTRDAAQTWTRTGQLPASDRSCAIAVDRLDPSRIFVDLGTLPDAFYSVDTGATWSALDGAKTANLQDFTTVRGVTYMLQLHQDNSLQLVASHDNLRSWQPVYPELVTPVPGAEVSVSGFWMRPDGSDLLVETSVVIRHTNNGSVSSSGALWETRDGGAHWTQIAIPDTYMEVQPPVAGQPWRMCGSTYSGSARNPTQILICSTDGGHSWSFRQNLSVPYLCPSTSSPCASGPSNDPTILPEGPGTLLSDGSVLLTGPAGPTKDGVIQRVTGHGLYLLPAGSRQWLLIGSGQQADLVRAPTPGGDLLWNVPSPINGILDPFFSGQLTIPAAPGATFLTARYP